MTLSNQRRWQVKMRNSGRCIICGQPRAEGSSNYCKVHVLYQRTRARNNYRKVHGIPLDSPIKAGRPAID